MITRKLLAISPILGIDFIEEYIKKPALVSLRTAGGITGLAQRHTLRYNPLVVWCKMNKIDVVVKKQSIVYLFKFKELKHAILFKLKWYR
jgi:hypothetical protein